MKNHKSLWIWWPFCERKRLSEKANHPNCYVAKFANQAWHTDLHYLTPSEEENNFLAYLIVFIDDKTHKILYAEILPYKSAFCTARALQTTLEINDPPKYLITNNGKEFISGEFCEVLYRYNVELLTTHLYPPKENGKCESFYIGLKELTKTNLTPQEAYESMDHWKGQEDAAFIFNYI